MKKIIFVILTMLLSSNLKAFADTGIFGGCVSSEAQIRSGNIGIETIPCVINELIDLFMGLAGTISIIFIIIGAYQMLFGSLAKDNSKGKTTIIYAISGFVLAAFSWVIIKFILDNFSN